LLDRRAPTHPGVATYLEFVRLLVSLEGQDPAVWRVVLVSPFTKLGGLHRVIQAAMGWDERWPHHFILCGDLRDRVEPGEILDAKRERNWRLDSAWYPDHMFFYVTGPQLEWRHRVVEDGYVAAPAEWRYPRCIGGERACPPGSRKPFSVAIANRRIWRVSPRC
jgi:hypothetical protein